MIEVDDSELTEEDRDFLKEWVDKLNVPLAELVVRILVAIVAGDQYLEGRPRD